MTKELFIKEDSMQIIRQKAQKKLHAHLIFLMGFLCLYFIVGYIVITTLTSEKTILHTYLIQSGIEISIWLISLVCLWNGLRVGRGFFSASSILFLYVSYYFFKLFEIPTDDIILRLIRILFVVLFIGKALICLLNSYRLYHKPFSYIWENQKEGRQSKETKDQVLIETIMAAHEQEENRKINKKKIYQKAQQYLRRYTVSLIAFVYLSILLFYLLMIVLHSYFPKDVAGIDYVQRYLLKACLYSAFIYSLPAIGMFLQKSWSKYTLLLAWLVELALLLTNLSEIYETFSSQHYGWPSLISFLSIQCIRYLVLTRISIAYLRNPFIKAFWKKHKNT